MWAELHYNNAKVVLCVVLAVAMRCEDTQGYLWHRDATVMGGVTMGFHSTLTPPCVTEVV